MQWFDANPHGPNAGIRGDLMWEIHEGARGMFPSSFARGGTFATTAFAPTASEAFKSPWRKSIKHGSPQHIENLRRMQRADPGNERITNQIKKAETKSAKFALGGRVARFGLGLGMVGIPAFATPGGIQEKGKAVAASLVGQVGWELGSKAGMGIGAALGSVIPGLGTAIGAGVGFLAGGFLGAYGAEEAAYGVMGVSDRMVERERSRRRLNWKGDTTAFMTRSAHTMRQQSLQAMNRGQMTARSMLGREGVMLHQ